jgi:hypothetical protein
MPEMAGEPPAIRLLREALEEAMGAAKAAAVLFEALASWGDRAPATLDEIRLVVRGPLRTALGRRIGEAHAGPVLVHLEHVILRAEAPTDVHVALPEGGGAAGDAARVRYERTLEPDTGESTAPHAVLWPDEPSTARLDAVSGRPVPIVVLAGTRTFASLLGLCLGSGRANVVFASSLDAVHQPIAESTVVVVDATDPPAIEAGRLAGFLARLPRGGVSSVFGTDTRFGAQLERQLGFERVVGVNVRSEEGIEAIVDLVRSRF